MPHAAYLVQPKKSVVALHDGKFHEYALLAWDDRISARFDERSGLVTIFVHGFEPLTRLIISMPGEDLRYLVLDLDQDTVLAQMVGIAEVDPLDESAVGKIHLFV